MTPMMRQWSRHTYPRDRGGEEALGRALAWARVFLDADPARDQMTNLVIFGEVGGGKTGLAWSVLRFLIEEHLVGGRFVIFPDLLALMKESFDHHVPFDAYINLGRAPVLVVDDVGAERPTEWAVSQLLTLVDRRFQRNLPTIYTSNYEPHALVKRLGRDDKVLGARIVSRMVGGSTQIRVGAPDRRSV
jgi:DNA replication protein DnaC